MAYLDNTKRYGLLAMIMASIMFTANVITYWNTPYFVIARIIPSIMLMIVGFHALTERAPTRGDVAFTYMMFVGLGLFASGIMLLFSFFVYYDLFIWQYSLVAPLGLVVMSFGMRVKKGRPINILWWRILQLAFVILLCLTVLEVYRLLTYEDLNNIHNLGGLLREFSTAGTSILMYSVVTSEIKRNIDVAGVQSKK